MLKKFSSKKPFLTWHLEFYRFSLDRTEWEWDIPFPPFHLAYFQALRSRQLKRGVPAHSSTAPHGGRAVACHSANLTTQPGVRRGLPVPW